LAVGIAKAYVDQQRDETASEEDPEEKPKSKKKLEAAPTAS